jgi:hypothetical protein
MMFNSRYRGRTVHKVLPPTTQQRIGRMYYILKARAIIKRFAVIQVRLPEWEEEMSTKRKLVVG